MSDALFIIIERLQKMKTTLTPISGRYHLRGFLLRGKKANLALLLMAMLAARCQALKPS
jgi:hypothetical protein